MIPELLPHVETIVCDLLAEGKRKGDERWSLCPFHDDGVPSFSVNLKTGLASCFGCQWKGDVIKLFGALHDITDGEAIKQLRAHYNRESLGEPEAIFDYCDENGDLLFQVVRFPGKRFRQRRPDGEGGFIWDLKDVKRVPYNLPALTKAPEVLFVEGEKDADNLQAVGYAATTTPGGSNSWRDDYAPFFKDKDVVLIPDNDEPGRKYMTQVGKSLVEVCQSVKWLSLPGLKDGEDVSNWLTMLPSFIDPAERLAVMIEGADPFNHLNPQVQVGEIRIKEVKEKFKELLQIKDDRCIEVLTGAVIANRIQGDPVWILLVAAPSSTKTELISSLREGKETIFLANMTPQTLISGKTTKGKNQSLLLRADFRGKLKIFIMKDFTTVLTMRSEPQNEILAQLREVYDGQYAKAFGTGELVDWEGKLGFIGGVTYIVDQHLALNQLLGERFLYYRIESDDRSLIGHKAKNLTGKESPHRSELRKVMNQFLSCFEGKYLPLEMSSAIENSMVALADLCTAGRTAVPRDKYTKTVLYIPEPEGPARMVKQLCLLGSGIGIVNGKAEFDADTYEVIKKIAMDSIPGPRKLILESLWNEERGDKKWLMTTVVGERSGMPTATCLFLLEDMMLLKLVQRETFSQDDEDDDLYWGKATKKRKPYYWKLTQRTTELIQTSGVFEDETF